MGKDLFENITNDEAATLDWVLKNEGATAADYFFTDPTVDGQIHELKKNELVTEDVTGSLKITELGRSALKEHKQISIKKANEEKQREDEISSLKAIAEAAQSQAISAKTQASLAMDKAESSSKESRFAKAIAIISIIVNIVGIIVKLFGLF